MIKLIKKNELRIKKKSLNHNVSNKLDIHLFFIFIFNNAFWIFI